MGLAFIQAAGLEGDEESVDETLRQLMDAGSLFVVGDYAMAGVLVFQSYYNRAQKVAQELFWWVDPGRRGAGAGIELLRGIEAWAREQGAVSLTMVCLDAVDGDRVAKLYERSGYRPLERNFVKVL